MQMTVKELIAKLQTLPQNAVIVDTDGDDVPWDIELWTYPWHTNQTSDKTLVFMRTNHG